MTDKIPWCWPLPSNSEHRMPLEIRYHKKAQERRWCWAWGRLLIGSLQLAVCSVLTFTKIAGK
ncbi:MAG: hypothetical protein WCL70_02760 [Paludibacter sp.]